MTVLHEDSNLGALVGLFAFLGFFGLFLASFVFLIAGRFRKSLKILLGTVVLLAMYIAASNAVSPRTIVKIGDGYCWDLWCLSIQKVSTTPAGENTIYTAEVRIFSDANRVDTSAKGASIYLLDERGRGFPLVNDPSVTPFDVTISPGQSVNTSLTFVAASDARELYLTGDSPGWTPIWVRLYFGSDIGYFHKPTLLRVL